jgi:hypothetical protein
MNAEQLISLADGLRSYALQSGRDLNESNLFAHTMLMKVVTTDSDIGDESAMLDFIEREYHA